MSDNAVNKDSDETNIKSGSKGYLPMMTSALAGGLAVSLGLAIYQGFAPAPVTDKAQLEKMVKKAIMDNPEWVPEAISRLQEQEVAKLLASNREAIEEPFAGAWAGNENGDVVLVEFFDYNCPYCRKSAGDVQKLLEEDPKLKVVYRDMPVLGPESERFALASLSAAKQKKYQDFYKSVFSGQGGLGQERLIDSVRAAGLDEKGVALALTSKEFQEEIEKNLQLARALGVNGTPSYIVGNEILSGAVGYEALKAAVERARKVKS